MYGYFSNYKYEPNFFRAKCQQDETAVRKAIYYFEFSPLKNLQSSADVFLNTFMPRRDNLQKREKEIKKTFNSWSFLAIFATLHLLHLRLAKKNLNEMELPFLHIYTCTLWSFIFNCPVSWLLSKNFKKNNDLRASISRVQNSQSDFMKSYLVPLVGEEAITDLLNGKKNEDVEN